MFEEFDVSEMEREQLVKIFKKALEIKTVKAKPELVREMVSIRRWVEDEYYIGQEGAYVYKYWKDQMIDIFGTNRGRYNEIVVTGSLGCRPLGYQYQTDRGLMTLPEIGGYLKVGVLKDASNYIDVYKTHIVGNKTCYEIEFTNGLKERLSYDHRLVVWEGDSLNWKRVEDLTEDDKVIKVGMYRPRKGEFTMWDKVVGSGEGCQWAKDNKVGYIYMISKSRPLTEMCGDIEVSGHVYVQSGLVNHNTGKTTFANLCMLRKLYELSCYTNVPGLFDLMPSSMVGLMYFNISKQQAELTGYGQFKSLVDSIPYFKEEFPRDRIESILTFPEQLMVLYGSSSGHSIGLNIIGAILDEANFYGNTNTNQSVDKAQADYSKVSAMYSSIVNRSASRFISKGEDSSLSILVSSNTITSSFTDERITKSLLEGDASKTKVINAKLWEVKPKGTYSEEMFWVFKGSTTIDPFVVNTIMDLREYFSASGIKDIDGETVEEIMDKMPGRCKNDFIAIPIDFRKSFSTNINTALQDIAGVSVAPVGRLFNSPNVYRENTGDFVSHPFTKDAIVLATKDPITMMDYLRKDWKPKDRNKKRYIHIDQSVNTDCTGFASSYVKEYRKTGQGVYIPIVCVDMKVRISPPGKPRQISLTKVQDFVFYLMRALGLEIGYLSQDSYASAQALQIYDEADVPCGLQSVDRTDEQYLNYTNMLYENQIITYDYEPEREELFNLLHFRGKRKVDHPVNGSKDVMDAIVGSVYNAITYEKDSTPGVKTTSELLEGMVSSAEDDELFTMEELLRD